MNRWLRVATAAAAACLLAGCVSWMLAAEDRKFLCRAAVEEKSGGLQFKPNPFSNPGGPLTGSAGGALHGAIAGAAQGAVGAGMGAILFAPVGAIAGAACAAAAAAHPTADADFRRILDAADARIFKRTLEAALNRERDECREVRAGATATAPSPDGIVAIEKLAIMMGCLTGNQTYVVYARYRTFATNSGRVLSEGESMCEMTSFRDVDDWFAHPREAQEEIEGTLAKTGKHIAEVVLADSNYGRCMLRSKDSGEIVERR